MLGYQNQQKKFPLSHVQGSTPKILLQLVTRLLVMKAAIERGAVTNLTTNDSKVAKM